jgi:hypothetical protein
VRQIVFAFTALAVITLPCRADQPAAAPATAETLIRLGVHPAAAARPALRYLLLPELKEMNPGNPCYNYLKCFMEQNRFFFDKEAVQRRDKLLTMPLRELPAHELQDYGSAALKQADWAARLDRPDWQVLTKLKIDGVNLLLPDLQQLRTLANALKVRFRAEVALGRFDDALVTAKTMFAISRDLGEHPTFIGNLVGIAIAAVALGPVEEMLEQPGCPNLYWALTNLPDPLVRLDIGSEGERTWLLADFHDLDDRAPMSPEKLKRLIAHLEKLLQIGDERSGKKANTLQVWLDARTRDQGLIDAARRRLVESGLPEERVQRFPPEQVFILDEKLAYEIRRDNIMKLMNLPIWQSEARSSPADEEKALAKALFPFEPAIAKVRRSQVRLQQRIALLRHVEALRLYAAEHDGALPASLADISVPLPVDPFTGHPFRYELEGQTAHIRGSPPRGEEKNAVFNVHYEVTIQKQEVRGQ